MKQIKTLPYFCLSLAFLLTLGAPTAHADKASAAIDAPQEAIIGSTITIKATITHNANNFMHYTKWAHILINGTEVARWDFSPFNRPESSVFTQEIHYTVTGPLIIEVKQAAIYTAAGNLQRQLYPPWNKGATHDNLRRFNNTYLGDRELRAYCISTPWRTACYQSTVRGS